jgi:hypothetical protein
MTVRPPAHPLRRLWVLAGLPLAGGLGLLPWLAMPSPGRSLALLWLGGLGVMAYAAAVIMPWPTALPWALGLLAVEYLLGLELRSADLDLGAPAFAALWFLSAELGWLGLEARRGGRPWPGRAVAGAAVAVGGAGLGVVIVLSPAVPIAGGPFLTGLGVLAAVGAAAALAWLARR